MFKGELLEETEAPSWDAVDSVPVEDLTRRSGCREGEYPNCIPFSCLNNLLKQSGTLESCSAACQWIHRPWNYPAMVLLRRPRRFGPEPLLSSQKKTASP